MKRKIEFYQKYITKLKALVEEDRGVADLFNHLQAEQDTDMDDLQDVADDGYRVEDIESRQINIEANHGGLEWKKKRRQQTMRINSLQTLIV